eukprot:Gregarina_sp_Pseudo_9__5258@NODE_59_length_4716_cov_32_223220_g55_i0_p5_GENE_NODE_59_length_4716_cov_32_223220_g55_i0NODE_59_length_4716_cov_32_223220_g55_i0_p5_ORF_typecomplete_len220_score76_07Ccdc124/PF06244_12/1_2e24NHS/PF15273_6/3_6_NODE_59_length_4716_cov_32_223220_g55_i038874546
MRGQNPKAVEARERKKAAATQKKEEEARRKEDAKWADDDKHVQAKLSRKAEQEAKQEEKNRRKAELRELEQEEARKVTSNKAGKPAPKKLTRADILLRQVQKKKKKEKEKEKEREETADLLQPNINHLLREERFNALLQGEELVSASGVDAALTQLEGGEGGDKHPEKRMKAAYRQYEEEWIERLRQEYPSLKRSQLKEKIFRQWQKAPENPMNQVQEC